MATIIKGRTPCAICGDTNLSRPFTATSGVAFPPGHDLYPYCDAPLHLDCLATWPDRERFSRGYFDMWRRTSRGPVLLADGPGWMLLCGPARPESTPYYVEVRLVDWPIVLKSRWENWPDYMTGAFREGLTGDPLKAAETVMQQARVVATDAESLVQLRRQALTRSTT